MTTLTSDPGLVIIRPGSRIDLGVRDLWTFRGLLGFLVWRDLAVRYKQTLFGVAWVLIQPLVSTAVFTLLFGGLLRVPSDGHPYGLFVLAALAPWTYFSSAIGRAAQSVVANSQMVNKVYFPRALLPLSAVLAGLADLGVSLLVLIALAWLGGVQPSPRLLLVVPFGLLAMLTALGFGLWLAATNVRFRDVAYALPFLSQVWMYVTPVIYGASLIPVRLQPLVALNPMSLVVEGYRYAIFGSPVEHGLLTAGHLALSFAVVVLVLISGLALFRRTESAFADVI